MDRFDLIEVTVWAGLRFDLIEVTVWAGLT